MGGEEVGRTLPRVRVPGLPPRGRGRAAVAIAHNSGVRITPAWAGKSEEVRDGGRKHEDYPRVGGEEERVGRAGRERGGLPPRGRGRVAEHDEAAINRRITPAWAGKSASPPPVSMAATGLPPRGRGRVCFTLFGMVRDGITPAWAGKSPGWSETAESSKDYPRVGGEEFFQVKPRQGERGLPPRGRGREWPRPPRWACQGITPAWAGKSAPYPLPPTGI